MRIPLSSTSLGEREKAHVQKALDTQWISGTGGFVEAFERSVAQKVNRQHGVAVNSGTSALELTLLALGIGPGDEVIVPALTFVAPAAAVRAVGANPILCDVTERDWTIDPEIAAGLVGPQTKAVIAVDVMGHPCDYQALERLGVPVIEDAAEAHGARYLGQPAGSFGVASVFSFHANKTVTTGEGGMVVTDDPELEQAVRLFKNHGMTRERPYWHTVVGRSYHMTNLTAAIGVGQVERWEALTAARTLVAVSYVALLAGTTCRPRPVVEGIDYACWLHTVTVDHRRSVLAAMRDDANIDARAIWPALSKLPLYGDGVRVPCRIAEEISATAIWLPTWAGMPADTIEYVAQALRAGLAVHEHG